MSYSFGVAVRAARLRFNWFQHAGCFVRLSGDGPFLCELCPPDSRMLGKMSSKGPYRHGVKEDELLASPFLARLRKVRKPFSVTLGNDGARIGNEVNDAE